LAGPALPALRGKRPDEFNILINPSHPDAAKLVAKKIRRWSYDARLMK
jgi:hypothetical protein